MSPTYIFMLRWEQYRVRYAHETGPRLNFSSPLQGSSVPRPDDPAGMLRVAMLTVCIHFNFDGARERRTCYRLVHTFDLTSAHTPIFTPIIEVRLCSFANVSWVECRNGIWSHFFPLSSPVIGGPSVFEVTSRSWTTEIRRQKRYKQSFEMPHRICGRSEPDDIPKGSTSSF